MGNYLWSSLSQFGKANYKKEEEEEIDQQILLTDLSQILEQLQFFINQEENYYNKNNYNKKEEEEENITLLIGSRAFYNLLKNKTLQKIINEHNLNLQRFQEFYLNNLNNENNEFIDFDFIIHCKELQKFLEINKEKITNLKLYFTKRKINKEIFTKFENFNYSDYNFLIDNIIDLNLQCELNNFYFDFTIYFKNPIKNKIYLTNYLFIKYFKNNFNILDFKYNTNLINLKNIYFAPLIILIYLKKSHCYFSINWKKNIEDYTLFKTLQNLLEQNNSLQQENDTLQNKELLNISKQRSLEIYILKKYYLYNNNSIFSNTNINLINEIREYIKYYNTFPLIKTILIKENFIFKITNDIFKELNENLKIKLIKEEVFVICFIKYLIPNLEDKDFYLKSLEDLCNELLFNSYFLNNSIFSYIIENFDKLNKLDKNLNIILNKYLLNKNSQLQNNNTKLINNNENNGLIFYNKTYLPLEICILIFQFISNGTTFLQCEVVCKEWNNFFTNNQTFWYLLYKNRWDLNQIFGTNNNNNNSIEITNNKENNWKDNYLIRCIKHEFNQMSNKSKDVLNCENLTKEIRKLDEIRIYQTVENIFNKTKLNNEDRLLLRYNKNNTQLKEKLEKKMNEKSLRLSLDLIKYLRLNSYCTFYNQFETKNANASNGKGYLATQCSIVIYSKKLPIKYLEIFIELDERLADYMIGDSGNYSSYSDTSYFIIKFKLQEKEKTIQFFESAFLRKSLSEEKELLELLDKEFGLPFDDVYVLCATMSMFLPLKQFQAFHSDIQDSLKYDERFTFY
ncbi:hypothetical protein ABK040_014039 [Willaertia magna]